HAAFLLREGLRRAGRGVQENSGVPRGARVAMRRAAIAALFNGIALYPVSFFLTVNAVPHNVDQQVVSPSLWLAGRALAVVTVALFAFSVVAAFVTTERGRPWWAVPATVLAIAVTYFDLIGFGFRP